jgi:PAT family beta-lactamase induction signal transducer AmpG
VSESAQLTPGNTRFVLTGNRGLRRVLFCLLYFAQGFPWGFTSVALLAALSEVGHSKEQTATVTALAILPWTFKFFWAPMIDSFRMSSLGLRRPWIAIAQLGMAVTLLGALSTGGLEEISTIRFIAWVFFVHNCFASLQDVATDALAVDLLEDDERGRVNGMMWASKLVGIGAGGALLGKIIAAWNLQTAVMVQAFGVIAILAVVVSVRERSGERLFPWTSGSVQATGMHAVELGVFGVAREMVRAMWLRTTFFAALVAVAAPMCEGLYIPLTTELFVQDFGWGAERFSEAQGTLGIIGELVGALLGGFLCDRFGRRRMAVLGMVLTTTVLAAFGATASWWTESWFPAVAILPLFKGSYAFVTVCLFSLFMKISWTGAAACQFTLYMAMSNVGFVLGSGLNRLNSWIQTWADAGFSFLGGVELATHHFYYVAAIIALTPIVFMPLVKPRDVERRREKEMLVEIAPSSSSPEG